MRFSLFALSAAVTLGLGCSKPLTSDAPDCTGLPVETIACADGPTVTTCARDASGHPRWEISCPGESTGGSTGTAAASGSGGASGSAATGGTGGSVARAFTVTFDLQNVGPTPVYVYQGCLLDLTLTQLSDPPHVIGRASGCGICDCAATSCQPVTCGPCYAGGVEVSAAGHFAYRLVGCRRDRRDTWHLGLLDHARAARGPLSNRRARLHLGG